MKRLAWLLATSAVCGCLLAQDATVRVDASRRAGYKIPRTIYGTFLEPIGQSIYPGLWAQVLENPSFEENLWSAGQIRRMLDNEPALQRASQLGLPLPWEPLDSAQGARYEPRWNEAANSYRSLLIMALPDAQTGVRQQVFLPVHRALTYNGSLYAKQVRGPGAVEVSLRRRNRSESVLARAAVQLRDRAWQKYDFTLELSAREVRPLEPLDFVIALTGDARALIDQVMLFPADAVDGMDPEMIELARALKTPLVRFGGNFTSAYHWRDGIGPLDKRISMLNLSWGMPEYNHFGTEEFLRFCRLIGAEPQIALNLGSGTPEEAAEWVRYVNEKWGKTGLLWELGNELWGDFQTGYPTLGKVAALTKTFAEAVRRVDPAARLIATGQDPDHFREWNAAQLGLGPGLYEMLATHFVVGSGTVRRRNAPPQFIAHSAFALPVELERRLRRMKAQIDEHPGMAGRVKIAFTEWLFHGSDDASPRFHNMGGAICAAGLLHTFIRTADFLPVADMTGLIEFGGIWKKRGRVYGVPAYWAFRMYSTADATTPVATDTRVETYNVTDGNPRLPGIAEVPYLDVVAALNDQGDKLTLFAVNRHLERDLATDIEVAGFRPRGRVDIQTLSAPSIYQANNEMRPEAIRPIPAAVTIGGDRLRYTFPRSSVTVLVFEAGSA
ncbi:MAG TPA: alpha-L-arabinofuranosidase C-terminal domain-containing protein [Bryobacteraceae bacterium]|nr:alpha-L-arabinofuranosidase C-terminal domain-containing protein [Bryobacteraceae bacterium]